MSRIADIKKNIKTNSNKKSYFVRWYIDSDKSKDSYNKEIKNVTQVGYETAMQEWLYDEDVQEAIKQYLKVLRNIKMLNIYESMYNKALNKGDVNAAKWIESFFKSDFFESGQDEINNYLEGINIPGLEGDK
ncbi:hypothetical protein Ccar_16165 [Clostridium carboxidivorans P7]|uniref:Uncharacterized protein n=1 Tax=Clostridium carboxidivorans P7 TaxID=536227 RepID=C6Q145_9CLOT|nr:hypothetical protein [Clostridium carboxidivorans]AKN32314.1 hypothetical protein Ccar_16165 [Clostridium carboxidivorans P7]EET84781.1 conserved hypothetical protein [Clostridium carboxidivorans P7]